MTVIAIAQEWATFFKWCQENKKSPNRGSSVNQYFKQKGANA